MPNIVLMLTYNQQFNGRNLILQLYRSMHTN